MEYIDLKTLPENHPLRDRLLVEIGAEYKHINGHEFKPVVPGRPMAEYAYNTLSSDWTNFMDWRAPAP